MNGIEAVSLDLFQTLVRAMIPAWCEAYGECLLVSQVNRK